MSSILLCECHLSFASDLCGGDYPSLCLNHYKPNECCVTWLSAQWLDMGPMCFCGSNGYTKRLRLPGNASTLVMPSYFTFQSFLTQEEAAEFFTFSHDKQVQLFENYLDYLSSQSDAAKDFTASPKASICYTENLEIRLQYYRTNNCMSTKDADRIRELVQLSYSSDVEQFDNMLTLLQSGKCRSGFGAWGTEEGYLPQKSLSLKVAEYAKTISHSYEIETSRKTPQKRHLNSRSFMFYWCHAEKQKLVDVAERLNGMSEKGAMFWNRLIFVVDRNMCPDCIAFAQRFAEFEDTCIVIEDPTNVRVLHPIIEESIRIELMIKLDK